MKKRESTPKPVFVIDLVVAFSRVVQQEAQNLLHLLARFLRPRPFLVFLLSVGASEFDVKLGVGECSIYATRQRRVQSGSARCLEWSGMGINTRVDKPGEGGGLQKAMIIGNCMDDDM